LVVWIALSGLPNKWRMLVANRDGVAVGCALAELAEEQEIVLYMLYVDPNCKGQGIGSALLDATAASYRNAKSMRLEALKNNMAAVDWYRAKRFEIYGETKNATGTIGVPAFYMQKML
jgi:ribosomal protein S18 acetylase RimI-like enzyme